MNNKTRWMTAFLLAVLLVGLASAFWGSGVPMIQQNNVLTVSGHGTVDTYPDEAVLRLAVVTQAEDVKNASDENAGKMDACLAALYEIGISEDDAVTSGYRVRPGYDHGGSDRRIVSFQVRNSLTVTVRDIEEIGDVIGAALSAGANEIDDVTFTVSDDRQAGLKGEAIADAVAKASADASVVADAMGVTIVGPVEISTTGSRLSPYRMRMDYAIRDDEIQLAVEATPMAAGPQILPGDVTVSAQVIVVYEFQVNQ